MEPQLVNLILEALKSHGQKLDSISESVTELKTEAKVGKHGDRILKLETVAWYAKVLVGTIGFFGGGAAFAKLIGIL